ncbi:hypothetical protein CHS0354_021686 [Potamilus streckersoni]|uniref:CXXC-type zinc finger protein 1 n=1 Tax=Potamilus streckersoni TaxID=2493646 RepID=A0AAE0TKP2_9BIVA|nr:hypothetical protein CHS0354_021686 [Potamilus streckersoni]
MQSFVLPERQAKVNQLIRAMEQVTNTDEEIRYCICRSTDGTRFMIGCDCCEEWYHGDCIGITADDAKAIKKFFCHVCRDKDPSLEIRYKIKKKHKISRSEEKRPDKDNLEYREKLREKEKEDSKSKKSTRRCGNCIACHRNEDCGRCDFCKDMRKYGGPNKIRQKCRLRQCVNYGLAGARIRLTEKDSLSPAYPDEFDMESGLEHYYGEDSFFMDEENVQESPKKRKKRQSGSEKESAKKKTKKEKDKKSQTKKKPKVKDRVVTSERHHRADFEDRHEEEEGAHQCYGPGCTEHARTGSKYCSDECGMKLAKSRIYELLPPKIQQWQSSPCAAEENNKRALEKIRRMQLEARQKLAELDLRHQELDVVTERARHAKIEPEQEAADTDDETEYNIYCVTCGLEVSQKTSLKHMEKCFAKFEAQTSFGSIYKTRIEGNSMFCDYYNPQQRTYCKRLKVLCPEHTKEPRVPPDEVCGCPIVSNVFEDTGEFCRAAKRKCNKHYCWEKLRRAEIDMERLRQWLKLDDLFEQERNVRVAMSNRMGVLGLMLHQTIDHDPLNPIIPPDID